MTIFSPPKYRCFWKEKSALRFPLLITILLTAGTLLFSADDSTGDREFDDAPVFEADEGITITGSSETAQQTRTVTAEEIQRTGAADMASLLEQTLDLPVTQYGPYGNTANVNIRGFGAGRVAILIDGIPVNSPQSGQFDIGMIDVNSIERIEVIYGGSDTKYNVSGAVGGIINIITIKKQKPGIRFGGSISNTSSIPGSYSSLKGNLSETKERTPAQDFFDAQKIALFASGGMEKFSWSGNIFANRSANHFLFKDFYRIQRRREHNEVYDAGGDASFVWERPKGLPEWSKLIFSTRLYYGDKNIPGSMSSRSVSKQKDFTTRQNIMLDMPFVFREDLSMEAAVSHSFSILDYTGPGSESLHKTDTVTVINRWEWFAGEKLSLQAGADYRFSYLDSDNIGVKTGHDGGLYLTAGYSPVRELLITPSVKVVFAGGDAGAVIPVPKLGVVWNASDRLTVKNNWYRSFKYPSFNDLYWAGDATARGNPDLKPEDGFGADLGTELTFEKLLSLQGTLYASWVRDSIHWRSSAGVWQPVNIGEALFFGFDTRIQSGFSERIILSLSYQFLLTRILTGDLTFASGIQMPYQPMHTAGVSVEIPWKTGNLTVSGHFESSRYTEALNVVKLDPFFILNISVNQSIGRHFTIFSVLKNALNTSYVSVQDYPMPGLSLTVGVRAAFE